MQTRERDARTLGSPRGEGFGKHDGDQCANAPGRFPAARRNKASRLNGAPPGWPVSGLAETTRVTFPGSEASQWIRHEQEIDKIPVRLPLRGQLRLGLWPKWRGPVLIPVELLLPDGYSEHQRADDIRQKRSLTLADLAALTAVKPEGPSNGARSISGLSQRGSWAGVPAAVEARGADRRSQARYFGHELVPR